MARTVAVPNVTNTVITGLTNGTAYNFVVRAVNAVGAGTSSAGRVMAARWEADDGEQPDLQESDDVRD